MLLETAADETSPPPAPTHARSGFVYRHRDWIEPIAVFLAIRLIGAVTLARFASLHQTSLGTVLTAWDGKWMLDIARYGYAGVPYTQTDARGMRDANTPFAFFPGFPYLVGAVARIPGVSEFGAAISVNVVLGGLAAVGAARLGELCTIRMAESTAHRGTLGRLDFLDRSRRWLNAPEPSVARHVDPRRAGLITVVLFAAAPMGVVLSMAYTEALFCALAAWALVGVLRRQWYLAGLTAFLSGFCRPTAAVLIVVVMAWAAVATSRAIRERDLRRAVAPLVAFTISPLGSLTYLSIVWARTGSPTGWFTIQTQGWGTQFDFGRSTLNFIDYVLVGEAEIAPMATAWILLATFALVIYSLWERLPLPLWLYGTLLVAQIAGSGGLMMSRPRLLLPAFVLLIPLAIGVARTRTSTQLCVVIVVVALSSWFGAHMLTVYPHAI